MKVRVNVANCWVGVEGLTGSVKVKFNLGVVGHVVAVDGDKIDGVAHKEKHHDCHQSEHPLLWRGDCCCYSLEITEKFLVVRTTAGSYKRVLSVDQPVDAEVGVDEDGQRDHQLNHGLQDGVVKQFIIESKLFAELRENL